MTNGNNDDDRQEYTLATRAIDYLLNYPTLVQTATPSLLRGDLPLVEISKPSLSPCAGFCYYHHRNNKAGLRECLDECNAMAAWKALADELAREIHLTLADIIWSKGNIDPKPLLKISRDEMEKLVRAEFAKGTK